MKLLCILLVFPLVLSAQRPDDYRWDGRFGLPGISLIENNDAVTALASTADYVVVGGQFTVPGKNIALWNKRTNSWEQAGEGIVSNKFAPVSGIFAEGDSAIIWGNFSQAGGKKASNLSIINLATKEWRTDTSLVGNIYSIVRQGGELIYSGEFVVRGTLIKNIARWNGSAWSAFTTDTAQQIPASLTLFRNRLFAFGKLRQPDYFSTFAEWNGSTWEKVFDTVYKSRNSYLYTLRGISAGNSLYVYGGIDSVRFANGNVMRCRDILRYDGANWEAITDTLAYYGSSNIQTVCLVGDDLYVGANFVSVNGIAATGIARWNEKTRKWNALGSGIPWESEIRSIVSDGANIYVGGKFRIAGAQYVNNIARYSISTGQWNTLADTNSLAPNNMTNVFADKGRLIAVGDFDYAGGKQVNYIASWNGREWRPLGSGIVGGAYKVSGKPSFAMWQRGINHCVRYRDALHIGGTYEGIGSLVCGNVTRYDDGVLQCLDSGVRESTVTSSPGASFYYASFVSDMVVAGNNLVVAGNFTKAGNVAVNCVARWDGSSWNSMGNTKDIMPFYPFRLSVDSGGGVLLGGNFNIIDGQPCNGLARWDGARWTPVGFTQSNDTAIISAICVAPNNDIYVTGTFKRQDGSQYQSVKRWNGKAWQDLGRLFPDGATSYKIGVRGDLLYIAGRFSQIGTTNAANVAVLNTKTLEWAPLGSGLTNGVILSLAFLGDTVYFGGEIFSAGGKPSFYLAAWLPANPSSVEQLSAEIPENIWLDVAPNPVATNGAFEFYLANRGNVRLVLADALGREVMTVAEGEYAPGSYRAGADVSLLPPGIYYARLLTASGTAVRAVVRQ